MVKAAANGYMQIFTRAILFVWSLLDKQIDHVIFYKSYCEEVDIDSDCVAGAQIPNVFFGHYGPRRKSWKWCTKVWEIRREASRKLGMSALTIGATRLIESF